MSAILKFPNPAARAINPVFQKAARMNAEAAARAFVAALDTDLAIFEAVNESGAKPDQDTREIVQFTNDLHDQAEASLIQAIRWSGPIEVDGYRYTIQFCEIQERDCLYAHSL